MSPWLLPPRGRGLTVSASSLLRFLVSAVSRWRAPLISFTRLVPPQPRPPPYISTEQTETESRAATLSHTPTSGHLDWGPSWPAAQLAWDITEISGRIDWNLPSNLVLLNRRTQLFVVWSWVRRECEQHQLSVLTKLSIFSRGPNQ